MYGTCWNDISYWRSSLVHTPEMYYQNIYSIVSSVKWYSCIFRTWCSRNLSRKQGPCRTNFFAEGHPRRWEVTLRQLRSLEQRILLIQSISKECCIVGKRRNLLQKERERERLNHQTSEYVLHQFKKKERENESKYRRKVANIIMLLWLPTIWICD